jgi:hypothetical protein
MSTCTRIKGWCYKPSMYYKFWQNINERARNNYILIWHSINGALKPSCHWFHMQPLLKNTENPWLEKGRIKTENHTWTIVVMVFFQCYVIQHILFSLSCFNFMDNLLITSFFSSLNHFSFGSDIMNAHGLEYFFHQFLAIMIRKCCWLVCGSVHTSSHCIERTTSHFLSPQWTCCELRVTMVKMGEQQKEIQWEECLSHHPHHALVPISYYLWSICQSERESNQFIWLFF